MEAIEKLLKKNKRYFLKVYRWSLSFLWKYKLPFLMAIGCSVITASVDVAIPKFIQYLIDDILPEESMSLLIRTLFILVPMVATVIIFTAIKNLLDRVITEKSGRDLQFTVLEKLRELGFAHHEKTPSGTTLSMFNNDVVLNLPNGLGTELGERGITLSGGQRQRLAIARAILQNPEVLILDEATSALDLETERRVQHNIDRLREGQTTIIIAHRLSTVENADWIYVMKDGQVAEQGTHAELMEHGPLYKELVYAQLRLEEGA